MNTRSFAALFASSLLLTVPALGQGPRAPGDSAEGLRYALQTCTSPDRYRRCLDRCDSKKRKYEDIDDCVIDPDPGGASTCREREVNAVRACIIQCKATYCPQYNP